MLIQILIALLIGIVFILFGYLVFTEKVPTLLDFFIKQGVTYNDQISNRFFGTIIMIIGLAIMLSPLIFGTDSMKF